MRRRAQPTTELTQRRCARLLRRLGSRRAELRAKAAEELAAAGDAAWPMLAALVRRQADNRLLLLILLGVLLACVVGATLGQGLIGITGPFLYGLNSSAAAVTGIVAAVVLGMLIVSGLVGLVYLGQRRGVQRTAEAAASVGGSHALGFLLDSGAGGSCLADCLEEGGRDAYGRLDFDQLRSLRGMLAGSGDGSVVRAALGFFERYGGPEDLPAVRSLLRMGKGLYAPRRVGSGVRAAAERAIQAMQERAMAAGRHRHLLRAAEAPGSPAETLVRPAHSVGGNEELLLRPAPVEAPEAAPAEQPEGEIAARQV
ncbi:MAG: hypothetical protein NT029_08645 [Armatimonadetes bacterium]|nr:hypothetical protein [Armatimonadota bacterium]